MKTVLLTSVGGRVGFDVLTLLDDLRDRLGSDAVVVIDPARLARPSAT